MYASQLLTNKANIETYLLGWKPRLSDLRRIDMFTAFQLASKISLSISVINPCFLTASLGDIFARISTFAYLHDTALPWMEVRRA
jgi:hypothetical protein